MTKQENRQSVSTAIRKMSAAEKDTASLFICLQILGTAEWQQANTVLLYRALPDEVDLQLLIQDATDSGKKIILPDSSPQAAPIAHPEEIDLAIIPGRAFTQQGKRLGRGGGWYDRQLPAMKCPRWGVAFPCQLLKEVPTDSWDVMMDRVITA